MTSVKEYLRSKIIGTLRRGEDPFPEIIGQSKAKKDFIASIIAERNVIIVGPPGIGKTTLAKALAKFLPPIKYPKGIPYGFFEEFPFLPKEFKEKWKKGEFIEIDPRKRFIRVQGSPDLTVEDLIGDIDPLRALKYGPLSPEAFTPGKIFKAHKGILFFDEINRAPPKVQNALLQVLEEKTVTIGSFEIEIPVDFIVIGTMNPYDYATEKLSDVFLDRFDLIYLGYPENVEEEVKIVRMKGKELGVEFPEGLLFHTIDFIRMLREREELEKKPSVRASIGVYEKSQAFAIIENKKKVDAIDVKRAIFSVLVHRIRLKPVYKSETNEKEFLKKLVEEHFQNINERKNDSIEKNEKEKERGKGRGREGSFRRESPEEKIKDGIRGSIENGTFIIDKREIIENIEDIKGLEEKYGKNLVEYLAGYEIEDIKKNLKYPEFKRKIKENVSENFRKLIKKGVINKNGEIKREVLLNILSEIVEKEEIRLKGEVEIGKWGGIGNYSYSKNTRKKYSKGEPYHLIDIKESVRKMVRKKRIYYDTFVSTGKEKRGRAILLLCLDCSGSMKGTKIKEAKKALMAISKYAIGKGDLVGFLAFNSQIEAEVPPTRNLYEIIEKVINLNAYGLTNISLALKETIKLSKGHMGHVILITDAIPTVGEDPIKETINSVKLLRNMGKTVSIVGINLQEGEELAKRIAEVGNGKFYKAESSKDLLKIIIRDYIDFTKNIN